VGGVDDPAVVAAIAAGELDGLATALDRYAAALYDYCYALAPAAAAEAVGDTFVIAWSSIDRLRDPAKLYPWLQAIAGNECFRRALVGGPAEGQAWPTVPAPEPALPPQLPGQVLSACADNTSVGRAYRVSVTYRAGPFGRDGFPKAGSRPGAPGPGARRPGAPRPGARRLAARRLEAPRPVLAGRLPGALRRRRPAVGTVVGLAVLAAVVAAASTVLAGLPSSGPSHERLAGGAAPAPESGGAPGPVVYLPASPVPSPGGGRSSPGAPPPEGAQLPASELAAGGVLPQAMAGVPTTGTLASPSVVPTATVTPGPTPSGPPVPGVLSVGQTQLNFVSIDGGESIRTFVITAEKGPVTGYTIVVPAGLPGSLTVSPSSGSLAEGDSATITVTAAGTEPFVASLTVNPGGTTIAVNVKVNPSAGKTTSPP